MKKWKNYLLSILAVAGCVACSDDDPGMPPVIDGNDVSLEIKRDTADVYRISLPITSEEGLAKVSLIDNATNKTINEQTSFSNPNNHTYTYDFDLTPYTDNTVVMLTLKIEDQAGQIVNKKITLTVKKFSELDVRFAAEGTITTQFEDCNLKVTVVRGMIPLKEIQVYVDTKLSSSFDLTLEAEQSKYDFNVLVEGLEMDDNTVKVVVIDEKEQEFVKEITVKRIAAKTWGDLYAAQYDPNPAWQGMMASEISFNDTKPGDLPGTDKLYRISIYPAMDNGTTADFEYDGNKITKMTIRRVDSGMGSFDELSVDAVYDYSYNEDGELVKVVYTDENNDTRDYITDVIYESGNIKSYKIDGMEYTPTYLEKNGTLVRVDYQDADLSGKTYGFATGKDLQPNSLFIAGLPAVVPGTIGGIDFNYFYNRYLFDTLSEGGSVLIDYDVTSIMDGRQVVEWVQDGQEMTMKYIFND
ncbi:hypothetical protein AALK14_22285 [Butyricimonas hominis]|uniref:hypothetical protein n=1 Tax=Butyricimonas hominis TaxID=2763032 RepID=UPI0035168C6A